MKRLSVLLVSIVLLAGVGFSFSGAGSGTESDPYQITTWGELDEVRNDLDAYYKLMNDLDNSTAGYDTYASSSANGGSGWNPVGDDSNPFTGSFNGSGYVISDLYIDRGSTSYVGLFGKTGSGSVVKNVGLENVNITGSGYTGGLVGENHGSVSDCYSNVFVDGSGDRVGGLIGYNDGSVSDSYSTGSVTGSGNQWIGGLVGYNDGGSVSDCYSTGSVSGSDNVGGLVGYNYDGSVDDSYATASVSSGGRVGGLIGYNNEGSVSDSFWDINTSGTTTSSAGTGKTTAEMQDVATFTDTSTDGLSSPWDFVDNPNDDTANEDIWNIDSGINDGYPGLMGVTSIYNSAPGVSLNYPSDGASDVSLDPTLNVSVTDADGDLMNVSFFWGNGSLIEEVTGVSSGSTVETGALDLDYGSTYDWFVNVTDGSATTTSDTWNFTTVEKGVSIIEPNGDPTSIASEETLKFNNTRLGGDYDIYLDGSLEETVNVVENGSYTATYSGLSYGNHSFYVEYISDSYFNDSATFNLKPYNITGYGYNASVYETTSNPYQLNVTYDSALDINASLNIFGDSFQVTETSTGVFDVDVTAPLLASQSNDTESFDWTLDRSDGVTNTSNTKTQDHNLAYYLESITPNSITYGGDQRDLTSTLTDKIENTNVDLETNITFDSREKQATEVSSGATKEYNASVYTPFQPQNVSTTAETIINFNGNSRTLSVTEDTEIQNNAYSAIEILPDNAIESDNYNISFELQDNLDSDIVTITSNATFNGTTKTLTQTTPGTNKIFEKQFTMPIQQTPKSTKEIQVNYTLSNQEYTDTRTYSENIDIWRFELNTTAGEVPNIILKTYNEQDFTQQLDNITYVITGELWLNNDVLRRNFTISTQPQKNLTLYIHPNNASYADIYSLNMRVIGKKDGYTQREKQYYHTEIDTTKTKETNLYLLNNTVSDLLTAVIKDELGGTIDNAIVRAHRLDYDTGEYREVTSTRSTSFGEAYLYLQPNDVYYKFTVLNPETGNIIEQTNPFKITKSTIELVTTIGGLRDYEWEKTRNINYNCDRTNTSVTCEYTSVSGVQEIKLEVYSFDEKKCTDTGTTTTDTLTCNISSGETYKLSAYINGTWYPLTTQETTEGEPGVFGQAGAFLAVFMIGVVTLGFGSKSPTIGLIAGYMGLIMASAIQLINLGITTVAGIGAVVALLLYIMSR